MGQYLDVFAKHIPNYKQKPMTIRWYCHDTQQNLLWQWVV